MHSTVKLHQFHSSTYKKFQSRLFFLYEVKKPQKPQNVFSHERTKGFEKVLKRREIVNLSPLFYALKRRRVHKFGFAALCAQRRLFLVGKLRQMESSD